LEPDESGVFSKIAPVAALKPATLELLPLLVLHPAAARPAAASRVTPATPVRVTKHLIWLLCRAGCGRPSQPLRSVLTAPPCTPAARPDAPRPVVVAALN
jgi:hypothetical protein